MEDSRRDFLKKAGISVLGFGCAGSMASAFANAIRSEKLPNGMDGKRWAMVIDTRKCSENSGCTACMDACHNVHNVPKIDSPKHEVKWIWKEKHKHAFPMQVACTEDHDTHEERCLGPQSLIERETLVLCNHCAKPPCVRVCPTQATWKRCDGIVMMDMHRCIGCRYCVVACPYGSRSFNFSDPRQFLPDQISDNYPTRSKGVVEKCNFCAERLARGMIPACVEACQKKGHRAIAFGDLDAPNSEVAKLIKQHQMLRRKPSLGTQPHVFYIV